MRALVRSSSASYNRVWFITGSSGGLGRALAEAVLARGERAAVTARTPERVRDLIERYPAQALVLELNVINREQVRKVVAQAADSFGRIDVLVNNAAYGQLGAIEELDDAQIRRQFETNVFGLFDVTRAVLPVMRRARRGHIINVSSVGGFAGQARLGAYNSSKFAVEGFSEALAQELAPAGIRVTIVEPGRFTTDWTGRLPTVVPTDIADSAPPTGATGRDRRHQPGDPARAADAIIAAVDSDVPPLRLVLGPDSLAGIRAKLAAVTAELSAWESISAGTVVHEVVEAEAN
ncbi:MAG TPA: oxidoreductase [Candidatus Nitrosotalea sp.]|nr:oxidoreductase [Candidatus Nitrosotalea sp.]